MNIIPLSRFNGTKLLALPLVKAPVTSCRARIHTKPITTTSTRFTLQQSDPSVTNQRRHFHNQRATMSFSNADTGSKPADPYVEKNLDESTTKQKIDDLVEFVEKCKFCLMTTRTSSGLLASRCMALAAKEGNGIDLIFHANTESGKTDDLQNDPDINLGFLNSAGEWASISGKASVETDRAFIHKYYSPALKAWLGDLKDGKHDGGPDDPRICAIKVTAVTATYAVSRRTAVGGFVELAKGVVTGDAPSVNKLRYIEESELKQYRAL